MELDDLKAQWKATVVEPSPHEIREALEKKISMLRRSGRGIRRIFVIEIVIVLAMYTGVLLMMWFMRDRVMSYMYKIIIVTAVGSLPVVWRMYKSQRWINTMDYSNDIRSNMIAFLAYYRNTLKLYQWSTYIVVTVLLVLMFSDRNFLELSFALKTITVCYMTAALLLTAPYIRITYGRKTSIFEEFLRE
ncbi:MAG: hypothetical protein WDO14_01060 [Bacteroidota bacterium]